MERLSRIYRYEQACEFLPGRLKRLALALPDKQKERTEEFRLRVMHPMDTGLVAGTPAFHLEEINFTDAAGKRLMRVETFEPVSENPVFTLQRGALAGPVDARGRDNNGNAFDARIAP